jgi:phosphate starvation-inducible protein PhoH
MLHAGLVDRVVITRPSVESGENLGFLPGDLNQKLNPFMRPIYDAIVELGGEGLLRETVKAIKDMSGEGIHFTTTKQKLEIAPLAYMRGRTFKNAFIIGDEMQNTTPEQMKMFLTRGGKGCIYAVCGDPNQFDSKQVGSKVSGLSHYIAKLDGYKATQPVCGNVNFLINPEIAMSAQGTYRLPDNNTMNIIEFEAKDVERHSVCAAICAMDEADESAYGKTQVYQEKRRAAQNRLNRHASIKDKLKQKRLENKR